MSRFPRARDEGIVTEELGDELVVYDRATQTAHALSTDAASVWRRCDGQSSVKDIAHRVGLEQARVAQALDELSSAELIEEPEGISRRALYKHAAKLGAAAVSAPLIYSIAIRPASAQPPVCARPLLEWLRGRLDQLNLQRAQGIVERVRVPIWQLQRRLRLSERRRPVSSVRRRLGEISNCP